MRRAQSDVRIGRQMEHEIMTGEDVGEPPSLQQIALHQAEARMPECGLEELGLARREGVVGGDLTAVGEKTIHQMTADETRAAGDPTLHSRAPHRRRLVPTGIATAFSTRTSRRRIPDAS